MAPYFYMHASVLDDTVIGAIYTKANLTLAQVALCFIAWLKSATQLQQPGTKCDCNSAIEEIGKISNLERLNLGSTPMNDAWILSLIRLVRLKHLDFSGCPGITGWGVRYLLRQLPYLEHLDLRGTGFTAKDQVELQKEFCHTKMVVGSTV